MHGGSSPGRYGDIWEIATPGPAHALPGVEMAGFRFQGSAPLELRPVPHPALTLVVDFGDRPLVVQDEEGRSMRGSLAAGLVPPGLRLQAEAVACVQVRLSPLVARSLLGAPAGELAGEVVALEDVWGPETGRLQGRLHDAAGWPERFALVSGLLRGRQRPWMAPVDREVAWAWSRIRASHGAVRVDGLADATGWSRQRLWSRFGAQVGLSPKQAARLVRFDHAVHRLASGHAPGAVAAEAGYADQSHLHREVRSFTGATPRAAADEPWLSVDDTAWPAGAPR